MSFVSQHSRDHSVSNHVVQEIIFNDHESNTGRSEVFLASTIDHGIFRHVNRTAANIRRHITNQRHRRSRIIENFRTADRVVWSDMHVIHVWRNREFRIISKSISLRRSNDFNLTPHFSLFNSCSWPSSGIYIGSFRFQEVEGDHAELHAGTTTQEKNRVSFRNIQYFFEQGNSLFINSLKICRTVRHFHDRLSRVTEL